MHSQKLFNNPDADIILRSVDNVQFRTFQSLLFLASPILKKYVKDNLSHEDSLLETLPIVPLQEDTGTVERLLLLIYPRWAPDPNVDMWTLLETKSVLISLKRFQMREVTFAIQEKLCQSPLVKKEPRQLYAVACQFGLDQLANRAMRYAILESLSDTEPYPEEEAMSAGALHRLLSCQSKCQDAVQALARNFWWLTSTEFVWFSCNLCGRFGYDSTAVEVSQGARCEAKRWWLQYMTEVATELSNSTCVDKTLQPGLIMRIRGADKKCTNCEAKCVADMIEFSKLFEAEATKVINRVCVK